MKTFERNISWRNSPDRASVGTATAFLLGIRRKQRPDAIITAIHE